MTFTHLLTRPLAVAVAYCNETTDGPFAPAFSSGRSPPPITISPDSVFFSTIPDTTQLRASVMAVREDVKPDVAWTSSDEAVATVDSTGLVISAGKGEARITASFGGKSAEVPVVVDQLPATVEIVGSSPIFFLALHEYKEARAVIRDVAGNLTNDTVTWRSSDPEIVRVPSRCGGTPDLEFPCARSLSEGSASLIATLADSSMADTISVRVAIAARIRLLTPRSYTFLYTDTTFQIQAEALDAAQSVIEDAPISYTSQDTTVVTVDGDGNVEVVGYGSTWIALHAGNVSMQVLVDVHFPVSAIRVDPSEVKLYAEGDSVYLSAIAIAANHNERPLWGRDVAWATTDASIVTVDDDGLLTAGAEGGASVIVSYADGNRVFRDTASVEVAYVGRISISPERLLLGIGQSAALTVTAYSPSGDEVHDVRVSWSSSDTTLLAVSDQGLVTGQGIGTARVTARVGENEDSAEVEVGPARYQIRPSSVTFERPLKERHLVVEFGITPLLDDSVEWSVADTTVAIIDDLGNLTSRRKGTTTVFASINGEMASASVTAFDPERDMLMAFYNATDGPNWNRNGNWGTDQLIYEFPGWEGVNVWLLRENVITLSSNEAFYESRNPEQLVSRALENHLDSASMEALEPHLDSYMAHLTNEHNDEYNELARKHLGRVSAIRLGTNNMSGRLPDGFFKMFSSSVAMELDFNDLSGTLDGLERYRELLILALHGNSFTGSIPDLISPQLFLVSLNNNELSGELGKLTPSLFAITMNGHQLTGEIVLHHAVNLTNAHWHDNAGLCMPVDNDYAQWILSNLARIDRVLGGRCGASVGPFMIVEPVLDRHALFTAAGDSIEVEFNHLDIDWVRVPDDPAETYDSLTYQFPAPGGPGGVVELVTHANGRSFFKSIWTGNAIYDFFPRGVDRESTIYTTVTISVDQEVIGVDVPDVEIPANTFGSWSFVGRDTNGEPAYLPRPIRVESSDPATAMTLRNGVLQAGSNAGTSTVTVTTPSGLSGSGTVTVTANMADSTAPAIDSIRNTVVRSGDTVVVLGVRLNSANQVFVDGLPVMGDAPPLPPGFTLEQLCQALWDLGQPCPFEGGPPFIFQDADSVKFVLPHSPEFTCTADRPVSIVILNDYVGDVAITNVRSGGISVADLSVGDHVLDISLQPSGEYVAPNPVCLNVPDGEDGLYLITTHYSVDPSTVHTFEEGEPDLQFGVHVRVSADDVLAGAIAEASPMPPTPQLPMTEDDELWRRHRQAEQDLRERERRFAPTAEGIGLAAARAATPAVSKDAVVGDTVFIQHVFGNCNDSNIVTGLVRNIGDHVVMISDVKNRNDYTDADYDWFTKILDDDIVPPLTDYFGDFPDVNEDGKVTVLFTDEVGFAGPGLLGWVSTGDEVLQRYCAASNEMEIFYGRTPDAGISHARMRRLVPSLIAHELTHVIQTRRSVDYDEPKTFQEALEVSMEIWAAEAQAMIGEEIVANSVLGYANGRNYENDRIVDQPDLLGGIWFYAHFIDLREYLTIRPEFSDAISGTGPCSWWTRDSAPCGGRSLWYGVGWSFWRYINDQYFPTYAAERDFHQYLISTIDNIWQVVEDGVGVEFEKLISDWNAMLYIDDLPGLDKTALARYQTTSWNYSEVFMAARGFQGIEPGLIPAQNALLESRRMKLGSGLHFLMDNTTSSLARSIEILMDFDPQPLFPARRPPFLYPVQVIRIK